MSFQDFLVIFSVMIALVVLRIGLPMVCTWGICSLTRHLSHQS